MSIATRSINSPALQASLDPLLRDRSAPPAAILFGSPFGLSRELVERSKPIDPSTGSGRTSLSEQHCGLPWSRQAVGLAQGALDGREHDFGIQPVGARPTEIR